MGITLMTPAPSRALPSSNLTGQWSGPPASLGVGSGGPVLVASMECDFDGSLKRKATGPPLDDNFVDIGDIASNDTGASLHQEQPAASPRRGPVHHKPDHMPHPFGNNMSNQRANDPAKRSPLALKADRSSRPPHSSQSTAVLKPQVKAGKAPQPTSIVRTSTTLPRSQGEHRLPLSRLAGSAPTRARVLSSTPSSLSSRTPAAGVSVYADMSKAEAARLAEERGLEGRKGNVIERLEKWDDGLRPGDEGGPTPAGPRKTMSRTPRQESAPSAHADEVPAAAPPCPSRPDPAAEREAAKEAAAAKRESKKAKKETETAETQAALDVALGALGSPAGRTPTPTQMATLDYTQIKVVAKALGMSAQGKQSVIAERIIDASNDNLRQAIQDVS